MAAAPAVLAPSSALPGRSAAMTESERRQKSMEDYRKRLIDHRELDAKLKKSEDTREDPVLIRAHSPYLFLPIHYSFSNFFLLKFELFTD